MSDNTPAADKPSPWTQPGFIVSAVIVGLLVVLGVVLVVTGPGDDTGTRPEAGATNTPAAPSSDSSDSACGLSAGGQAVPRAGLPNTGWELVGTMAVPAAPKTHGPGRTDAGLRTCFAHSPTGALYSAANFAASASDAELQARAARDLTASGPGRDRAVREAEGTQPQPSGGVQIVGFTFLNYSKQSATVDLAFRATNDSTTGLVHVPLSMRWEDGDWKAVVPESGGLFPGLGAIPDLTGYVPWSGA